MKHILLSQGFYALIDDDDFEEINKHKWSLSTNKKKQYATRQVRIATGYKGVRMHRQIMEAENPKQYVDHKDGNGLNNQKSNLRICTHGQNRANSEKIKKGSSAYKGVSWSEIDKKWRCHIRKDKKQFSIGYFKTEIEAAIAYNQSAIRLHGEFARLNNV